jgi:hypothetical protein
MNDKSIIFTSRPSRFLSATDTTVQTDLNLSTTWRHNTLVKLLSSSSSPLLSSSSSSQVFWRGGAGFSRLKLEVAHRPLSEREFLVITSPEGLHRGVILHLTADSGADRARWAETGG